MRSLAVSDLEIPLGDPNPDYAGLVAAEEAAAAGIMQSLGRVHANNHVHIQYWTEDDGVKWSDPENFGLEIERDLRLGCMASGVLLDLGCGGPASVAPFRRFIKPYGVEQYIGVSNIAKASYGQRSQVEVPDFGAVMELSEIGGETVPGAVVHGDMLNVLSQLPMGSMHVSLNGVDRYMLACEAYRAAVAREIIRVVQPGGLVFGVTLNAGVLPELAESGAFNTRFIPMPIKPPVTVEDLLTPPPGPQDGYYFMNKI